MLAFSVVGISVRSRVISVLVLTIVSVMLNVIGLTLISLAAGSTIDADLIFGSFAVA